MFDIPSSFNFDITFNKFEGWGRPPPPSAMVGTIILRHIGDENDQHLTIQHLTLRL